MKIEWNADALRRAGDGFAQAALTQGRVQSMKRKLQQAIKAFCAIAALTVWLSLQASAGTTVYKCVQNGQITLTDKPCPSDKSPAEATNAQVTTVVPSIKDPSPVGRWSGQLQYQETSSGQTIQAAHSVALMSAEFTDDGKVTGVSTENGCQLLGVWSNGGQTLIWVDLTFDHCAVGDLNRRYHGSFILARPDSSGNLSVQSIGAPFSRDTAKYFDVKGTLRRQG